MKLHTRIQKWGNGLALRVSGAMRDLPHFQEGTEVEVEITAEGFIVKKIGTKNKLLPFTEAQLLNGITKKLAHADLVAKPLKNEFE